MPAGRWEMGVEARMVWAERYLTDVRLTARHWNEEKATVAVPWGKTNESKVAATVTELGIFCSEKNLAHWKSEMLIYIKDCIISLSFNNC